MKKYLNEILLLILWLCLIFVINPIGDFPLNDDWVYSQIVDTLLKEGRYVPGNGPITTLIAQVYWGALFSLLFGKTYTVLRISTLAAGAIGIMFLYRLLLRTTSNKNASLAGAIILMLNPLYLSLSFTFMSDVPFISMCIVASLLFYEYLKKESLILLAAGTIFSVIAVMIRQLGLLIPFAFLLTYIISNKAGIIRIIKAGMPLLISVILFLWLSYWIKHTRSMPEYYNTVYGISNVTQPFKTFIIDYIFKFILRIGNSLMLCAMCFAPLIILILPNLLKKLIKEKSYLSILITGLIELVFVPVYLYFYTTDSLLKGNMIYNLGTGPKLLRDTYIWKTNISPRLDDIYIYIMTAIGMMLMAGMLIMIIELIKETVKTTIEKRYTDKTKFMVYALSVLIIYCGYFSISTKFHDRYLLPFMSFLLIIIVFAYQEILFKGSMLKHIAAWGFFIIISYFSIGSTYDYLSWNRVRWEAIKYLTEEKKAAAELIDGGYEYNGLYNPKGVDRYLQSKIYLINPKEEYMITFGNMYNYTNVKTFFYPYMIYGTNNKIEVLMKNK